jgi:hypothetical protein
LNKKTGKILVLSEYMSENAKNEIRKKIRGEKMSDYVPIPTITSHEGYLLMEEYAEQHFDKKLKDKLKEALSKDAPFKNFKEIIYNLPEERERWLVFKRNKILERAKKWCSSIGIEVR